MKRIPVLLALLGLAFAQLVFANAIVTTATGSAQVIRGTAPARALKVGDEVIQGDTIVTGQNSAIVMKFDDGEITALTSNSRLTVTAYQYNRKQQSGSILLSLVEGGMRAITGLIGKNAPQRVSYKAATATIGTDRIKFPVVSASGAVLPRPRKV